MRARRARLCIVVALSASVGAAAAASVRFMHGRPELGFSVLAVALFFAAVPLLQFRTGSVRGASQALVGLMAITVTTANLLSGGVILGLLMATAVVPLVGVLLLGARSGAAWGTLAIAQAALAPWLTRWGFSPLLDPPEALHLTMLMVAPPVTTAVTLSVALAFRHFEEVALGDVAHARDEAEAASRAKSTFLASMSHELRTPMNGIVGALTLLEDEPLTASQRRHTKIGMQSAETLLALLGNVLDLAKIEAGALTVEQRPFHVGREVRDAAEALRAMADQKKLTLRVGVDDSADRWALGDPARVRQLVTNLLGNAIKFTDLGHVGVSLRASEEGRLLLEVTDTGPGIDEAALPQVFEPFTRGTASSAREGAGLGLAIVNEVVATMGGTVGVTTEHGRGTRFAVELPLPETREPRTPTFGAPNAIAGQRVLVVEDNEVNQLVLCELLQKFSIQADVANDGRQGVDMWASGRYDAILMDCHMPRLDGFAATRQIRDRERDGERVPIVALTANALRGDRERCLEAGMDDYLAKPVRPAVLVAVLRRYFGTTPEGTAPEA